MAAENTVLVYNYQIANGWECDMSDALDGKALTFCGDGYITINGYDK